MESGRPVCPCVRGLGTARDGSHLAVAAPPQPGLQEQPSPHLHPPSPPQQLSPPAQHFLAHEHVSHAHLTPQSQQHLQSLVLSAGQVQPGLQPQEDMVEERVSERVKAGVVLRAWRSESEKAKWWRPR